jgi:hypothetical protein
MTRGGEDEIGNEPIDGMKRDLSLKIGKSGKLNFNNPY